MDNTTEIITTNDIIETMDEIIPASDGNGLLIVAVIGLTAIGSVVAYELAIKPAIAKVKAMLARGKNKTNVVKKVEYTVDDESIDQD